MQTFLPYLLIAVGIVIGIILLKRIAAASIASSRRFFALMIAFTLGVTVGGVGATVYITSQSAVVTPVVPGKIDLRFKAPKPNKP